VINTHIHLDFNRVKHSHLSAQTIIVPSVGKENWDKVCNYQHYALGIHPWYIEKHSDSDLKLLENIIKRKKPIAIGECGLDFSLKRKLSRKNQLHFFKHQIELALMFDLPLIIHSVKSNNEVIENLKTRKKLYDIDLINLKSFPDFLKKNFNVKISNEDIKYVFNTVNSVPFWKTK